MFVPRAPSSQEPSCRRKIENPALSNSEMSDSGARQLEVERGTRRPRIAVTISKPLGNFLENKYFSFAAPAGRASLAMGH